MKKLFWGLLFVMVGVLSVDTHAQSTEAGRRLRDFYDKETIYLFGNNKYVKDNMVYMGQGNLKREFQMSEGGMQLYLRSRKNKNISAVISLTATLGSIIGFISDDTQFRKATFWSSIGLGLVGTGVGIQASNQLNQAVWLRNRDVLKWSEENK